MVGAKGDKSAVAKFAADLFGEEFNDQDVILGDVEAIAESGTVSLGREDYHSLSRALDGGPEAQKQLAGVASKLGVLVSDVDDAAQAVGDLLQRDNQATELRRLVTDQPAEVQAIADAIFADLPPTERVDALSDWVALLLRAKDPVSTAPLLSTRYHLFLRSLEGAFLSFWPDKNILLDRRTAGETALFEVGLCRECGQHYLVGKVTNDRLLEGVRDPGRADFGATFFLPVDDQLVEDENTDDNGAQSYLLCSRCGEIRRPPEQLHCDHNAVAAVRAVWEAFRQCDEHAPTANDRLLIRVHDARRLNPDWWRLRFLGEGDSIYRCDTCGRIQALSVRGLCPRHRCPGSLKQTQRRELDLNHYRLLYEAELPGSLRAEEHTAQLDKEKAREFQREFREGKIHVLSCSTTFELGVDLGDLDTIFLRNVPPEAFNYAQRVGRSGRRSGHPGFAITYCRRGPHDLYHFSEPHRMLTGKVQPPVIALRNEKIIARHIAAVALSFFFRAFPERFPKVESLFKDLSSPSGVADFRAFLVSNRSRIEETIRRVVPGEMAPQLGLSNGSWIDKISGENSRFALAEAVVSDDHKTVMSVEESARNKRDYRAAEWAQRRADTIAKEDVLSFLSRKAVIPKYGFPVDVVELDTQRTQQNQEAFEVSLQRDLSIAISEFAPTSKLVANKKEWTSYGLKKVAEREWPTKFYARCPTHNVFRQWNEGEPEPTLPCGERLRAHKYVIPQFGFVTNRDKAKDPKARPARWSPRAPTLRALLVLNLGLSQCPPPLHS